MGSARGVVLSGFCKRGGPEWVLQEGWSRVGSARGVVQSGFCKRGGPEWVLQEGWSRVGSLSKYIMNFFFTVCYLASILPWQH